MKWRWRPRLDCRDSFTDSTVFQFTLVLLSIGLIVGQELPVAGEGLDMKTALKVTTAGTNDVGNG